MRRFWQLARSPTWRAKFLCSLGQFVARGRCRLGSDARVRLLLESNPLQPSAVVTLIADLARREVKVEAAHWRLCLGACYVFAPGKRC